MQKRIKLDPKDPNLAWEVKDNLMHTSGKRPGSLWTERTFQDFEAEFEWRVLPNDDDTGKRPWIMFGFREDQASFGDCLLMLYPDGDGVLVGLDRKESPRFKAKLFARGNWNRLTVQCRGPQLVLVHNGEVLAKVDDVKPRSGHIAVYGAGAAVELRTLRVREFESKPLPP